MDILTGYIVERSLDLVLRKIRRIVSNEKDKLTVVTSNFENSINHHLKGVLNWSSEISFKDLSREEI